MSQIEFCLLSLASWLHLVRVTLSPVVFVKKKDLSVKFAGMPKLYSHSTLTVFIRYLELAIISRYASAENA